jgi:hypothetical protein
MGGCGPRNSGTSPSAHYRHCPRRCLSQHPPTLPKDTPLWTLQRQDGQCLIHIEAAVLDRLRAMSSSASGIPSTVTAATSISADASPWSSGRPRPARLERVLMRSLGPSPIPSHSDGVMLGTAWIDRPVDTQGLRSCFHVFLSAAWKRSHAQANDRHSSRVFAMPPRGFARTTRNG